MISEADGNLLTADVDALVNTVNTVGIMGKGIALQFKRAFPTMFKAYARAAKAGELRLGEMYVWPTQQLDGPRFVINFPTKGHWKTSSRLADIERGLDDLVRVVRDHDIASIAVPPLGCGNGGLDWAVVEPLIHRKLEVLSDVDVRLYPPVGAPRASSMVNAETAPRMTPGRAALIQLLVSYRRFATEDPTLIEVQKLMYFLQAAGEKLKLNYAENIYGPYADNLRYVLRTVEGHYLSGYGDGATPVQLAEPISVLPGAEEAARPVIAEHPETAQHINRVLDLVGGFESAYALELLATVHWVMDHGASDGDVVDRVRAWSPRKQRMFTVEHIEVAASALRDRKWSSALSGVG